LVLLSLGLLAGLAGWHFRAEQHLRRAEKALEQREDEDALWHVESYLRMKPNQARAHFLAARAARRLQRYDKATDHLHACRLCGWDPEAIDLEHTLIALQRGEAGVEPVLWSRVRNGDPHTLPILEVLIQYYLDTYRLNRALECLNNYLECRPDDLHALLGRAYVWERMLYFADALNDYRRAVESHSDSEAARLRLAKTLLIAGTPGEALDQFKYLYKGHADQPEVKLGMAQCQRRLGQFEEAKSLLDEFLAERPDDAEALWERGQLALDQEQTQEAEDWLRKAVRRAPHDRKANYSLYQCLLQQGRQEEAGHYRAHVNRIDANLQRLDRLTKAVLKSPDDAMMRCQVGIMFLENGEETEGVRWLTLALRMNPGCQAARRALGEYAGRTAKRP
jgi:tetratricopeptide (TPR) repeat protein